MFRTKWAGDGDMCSYYSIFAHKKLGTPANTCQKRRQKSDLIPFRAGLCYNNTDTDLKNAGGAHGRPAFYLEKSFWLRQFPPRAGGHRPAAAGRAGCAGGDAHRCGQIHLLSGAGAAAAGHHHRGVPAGQPDEGPGGGAGAGRCSFSCWGRWGHPASPGCWAARASNGSRAAHRP